MPVTASGHQARWDAMNADPVRRRQLAAGRQREQARAAAWHAEGGGLDAQIRQLLAGPGPVTVVRNAAGPARVDLLDEISWWGITAADFADALAAAPGGDLEVHVNSPGGDIFDGIAIMNMLRQRPGQVTVVIDGLAASAASVIAMAASPGRLLMAPNATMMIHDAWTVTAGSEQDHRDVADVLGRESDNIASVYAARTGQPASAMRDWMRAETWFIGAEAVDAGLADAMLGGDQPAWLTGSDSWPGAARDTTGGPGRPGNSALRRMAYARWSAQSGRSADHPSPYIASWLRP